MNLKSELILQQVEESIATITDNRRSIQSGFDQVSRQVKDRSRQLKEEVKKWEQHNLQKLQNIKQQQNQSLQEALKKSEAQRSRLQEYKQYVDILRERGKDPEKTSRYPGLQALVQKQRKSQPEFARWRSQMLVQCEGPEQWKVLSEIRGSISGYLAAAVLEGPKHKQTIRIQCKGARDMRLVTLLGHQQVLHCFNAYEAVQNKTNVCIHSTDGCVKRLLAIPKMTYGYSLAVVDPARGKLVVADHNEWRHDSGCLHWITLSPTYDIIKHEITQLQCRPNGCINVDSSGRVLVITRCTSQQHRNSLVIYDKETHRELKVIDLSGKLRWPLSAVNSAPGVFTVVDSESNKVVWLDFKGHVLRTYGNRPQESLSHPSHVAGHTEGYLLICDRGNHRLHLLSRKGAFLQYLLCKERDHIEYPCAIHLDEQAGLLAVSCSYGTLMVFSFSTPDMNSNRSR